MGRRIFSKPLSQEGRDNFDKIFQKVTAEDAGLVETEKEQDEREEQK